MNRFSSLLIAAAVVATGISSSQAAQVFSANFDGAAGTSVTGVTGGSATLVNSTVQTATPLGDGGYLQLAPGSGGVTFTPASPANSLGSWSSAGGQAINGGLDFFIRPVVTSTGTRFIHNDGPNGGLGISIHDGWDSTIFIELLSPTLYSNFSNVVGSSYSNADGLKIGNTTATTLTGGNIFHVGLMFSTDAANLVTGKLYIVPGAGAIDTSSATGLTGQLTFNVAANPGFTTGAVLFGDPWGNKNTPSSPDFDAFRIYDAAPASFPGLVPEPSVMAILALGAPMGLLRRRRTGSR